MTDEQQPELRWAPIPPKPRNRRRVWLIVGLSIAALAIVGALLFFLLPRGASSDTEPTASPSPSSSPTATGTATPTPTPPEGAVEPPVQTEAPPYVDPSIDAFRGQVSVWLESADSGLDIVSGLTGEDALAIVQTLDEDAQRLSATAAPSAIGAQWSQSVATYTQKLAELRAAVNSGTGTAAAVTGARTALQSLNSLVGL